MSSKRWQSLSLLLLLAGVVAIAVLFLFVFVPHEYAQESARWERRLTGVVADRKHSLEEWIEEGLVAAGLVAGDPAGVELLGLDPSSAEAAEARRDLAERYRRCQRLGAYCGVRLFRAGEPEPIVDTAVEGIGCEHSAARLEAVLRGGEPQPEIERSAADGRAVVSFCAPVREDSHEDSEEDGALIGAVVLMAFTAEHLHPILANPPAFDHVGEVVLVRPHGDGAGVREYQLLTPWDAGERRPFDTVQAEKIGLKELPDGVRVAGALLQDDVPLLTVSVPVAQNPDWRLVALVEESKAFADYDERILQMGGLFVVLTLALLGVAVGFGWRLKRTYQASLAESAARETERLHELTTTLNLVPAAVLMARDRECQTIVGNRAAYEMLRVEPGANIPYPPDDPSQESGYRVYQDGKLVPAEKLPVRRAAREGLVVRGVANEIRFEDGKTVHIVGNAAPLRGDDGEPRGAVAAYLDVTAMKATDEALQNSLSLLESTLEATDDGFLVIDLRGQIVLHNRRLVDYWEIPSYIIAAGDARRLLQFVARRLREPQTLLDLAKNLTYPTEGEVATELALIDDRTCEVALRPQRIGERVVGRVWTFRDISARRRAEQTMRYAEQQIHQSQKLDAVGRLAGGVAHDLNNVLSVVTGYSDLLMQAVPEGSQAQEKVQAIREAADRAARLTGQLLTFSRRQSLMPSVLDLNEVVRGVQAMLKSLVTDAIQIETYLAADLWPILADRGQMEQVIMNLAVNARDAMPQGGTLTVATANVDLNESAARWYDVDAGRYVRVAMRDTGHGMTREVQNKVFDPFFTTKPAGEGTGLGLATVYGVVTQSGGAVTVDSEPGKGSVFEFVLPAVDAQVESGPAAEHGAGLTRGSETILLVEDEAAVRAMTVEVLTEAGYRVLQADGAQEAERIAEDELANVDLLLTDVVMPQTSGVVLAKRLRDKKPDLRVLFVSGYADGAAVGVELEPGDPFLQKPFPPAVLAKRIRELFDGQA